MSLLDLFLAVVIALSAAAGYRMGFLVRAAGVGGVLVGLALSVATVPFVTDLVEPATPITGLAVTAFVIVITVLFAMILLQTVAFRVRGRLAEGRLRSLDRFGGAVAGIVGTLVFVWFTAPLAGMVPGGLARQVRGSAIVALVTELTPGDANPLAALQTLIADTRFPEVFSDLAPAPATGPPPTELPVPVAVSETTAASAVKVEVSGCGAAFSGSGWTVDDELVVTNAHVVAGADEVQVRRADGDRLEGEVVVFDDDRDLALVRVPALAVAPLPLGEADPGEGAATFGHPRGQEQLRIAPARIDRTIDAVGRDIYGLDRTEREVVVLAAALEQGDSGSAVVDGDGTVVGTVFAVSPDDPDTSYALSNDELRAVLDAPRSPGDTGPCT